MKPEIFFLKYAFPCSFIIKQRGEITQEEYSTLENAAVNNEVLQREFLERVYFRAFQRIKIIAKEMKKEIWDLSIIKSYFREKHNEIIDDGMYSYAEAPPVLKELCKVYEARVISLENNVAVVEYAQGKRRPVITSLVSDLKPGNLVTIHYGYAVERL